MLGMIRRFFMKIVMGTVLLLLLPLFLGWIWQWLSRRPLFNGSIVVIAPQGPMPEHPDPMLYRFWGKRSMPFIKILDRIAEAKSDPRIRGILLDLRGEPLAAGQIWELIDAIDDFRQSGKWTGAYAESLESSEINYALAAAAEQIYISPPGDIFLRGLRADIPFMKKLLQKFHIPVYVEKREKYKNFADSFTEMKMTPEHQEALTDVLRDIHENTVAYIAQKRHVSTTQVEDWIKEGPYFTEVALQQRMIDGAVYWDELMKILFEDKDFHDYLLNIKDYRGYRKGETSQAVHVALIVGQGEIQDAPEDDASLYNVWKNPSIHARRMVKAFEDARADKVKGILLRLNTPGGAYIPSDIIRHQIELTTKANIPVVVSMGSLAASGGYLIASAANRIFAHPVTITGSIGVVALQMAFRSFFDDFLGISFSSIQIPEQSERSVPFLDLPDTHTRRRYKESVDHIYDTFISKVAQGRQRSKSSIEKVAKGRIWSGQQALAHGLVDELGGIRQAKNYLCIILQCKANQRIALDFYPEAEAPMETFGRWINQAKAEQLQMTWQQILQQLRLLAQSYPVFSL